MKKTDEINADKTNEFPRWVYLLLFFSAIILAVTLAIILARIILLVLLILLIVLIALYLLGPILDIKIEIMDDLRKLIEKPKHNVKFEVKPNGK